MSRARAVAPVVEALGLLALIASRAPEHARGQFRDELRRRGLADPGDLTAPANAARPWSQPPLYVEAFGAAVLPALGDPERAAALAAIASLSERPARRSRAGVSVGTAQSEQKVSQP
jgi:hypothetical protein